MGAIFVVSGGHDLVGEGSCSALADHGGCVVVAVAGGRPALTAKVIGVWQGNADPIGFTSTTFPAGVSDGTIRAVTFVNPSLPNSLAAADVGRARYWARTIAPMHPRGAELGGTVVAGASGAGP